MARERPGGSIATEMVKEKLIDWKTAIKRVPAEQLIRYWLQYLMLQLKNQPKSYARVYPRVLVLLQVRFV